MKTKRLGPGGPPLSVIGFGAWEIGIDPSPPAQERAIRALRAGIAAGMTWVDTAEEYGPGRSEEIVARALADRPDVLVGTKLQPGLHGGLTPHAVRQGAEGSLRRLRREVLDLYFIHDPDPANPLEEAWGAMARLVEDGLARYIGVSNFDAASVERCERVRHVDALQYHYSLLYREEYEALRPHCERYGTAFFAYGPLALGLLTGRIDPATSFATTSWGHDKSADTLSPYQRALFGPAALPRHLRAVARLQPVAERLGIPLAHLALAWVVARDNFTVAIAGSTSPEHTRHNAAAGELKLDEAVLQELAELAAHPD
jgi:aryl-alcohol dehydrogenase-like predicted oxidoreductase